MNYWRVFLSLLLILAPVKTASAVCENATGAESTLLYDDPFGIDGSRYHEILGRVVRPLTNDPARNTAYRNQAREEAYEDAFQKINAFGLSYTEAKTQYIEDFLLLHSTGDQSINRREIRLLREQETLDCSQKVYIFEVHLLVPRYPSLGEELGQQIAQLARDYVDTLEPSEGSIEIVLSEILHRASIDPTFRSIVQKYLKDEAFLENLAYRDDDTRRFFLQETADVQIAGYALGQYRINSLVGAIIDRSVRPKVEQYLSSYREVQVLCTGYTDSTKVRGSIPYSGRARLSSPDPIPFNLEARVRDEEITSNLALSFARGHEGIAALANVLGLKAENSRLQLLYFGGGPLASQHKNDPESRKIRFKITFRGKR